MIVLKGEIWLGFAHEIKRPLVLYEAESVVPIVAQRRDNQINTGCNRRIDALHYIGVDLALLVNIWRKFRQFQLQKLNIASKWLAGQSVSDGSDVTKP